MAVKVNVESSFAFAFAIALFQAYVINAQVQLLHYPMTSSSGLTDFSGDTATYVSSSNCPGSTTSCWNLNGASTASIAAATTDYKDIALAYSISSAAGGGNKDSCLIDYSLDGVSFVTIRDTGTGSTDLPNQVYTTWGVSVTNKPSLTIRLRYVGTGTKMNCYFNQLTLTGALMTPSPTKAPTIPPTEMYTCRLGYSCNCNGGGPCAIKCSSVSGSGTCSFKDLGCPSGHPCTVNCNGESACGFSNIVAAPSTDVTINCNGLDACVGTEFNCGSGDCLLNCINGCKPKYNAPTLRLNSAKSFQCIGDCPSDIASRTFTAKPTRRPTMPTTAPPTSRPTNPTANPSTPPTRSPTLQPTINPTESTLNPSTSNPTANPSAPPTRSPTLQPTSNPTESTLNPSTLNPTANPSTPPSLNPTLQPSINPTEYTLTPSTSFPTESPTLRPTPSPTRHYPTACPGCLVYCSRPGYCGSGTCSSCDEPKYYPIGCGSGGSYCVLRTTTTAHPSQVPTAGPTDAPTESSLEPTPAPSVPPTLSTSNPTNNPVKATVAPVTGLHFVLRYTDKSWSKFYKFRFRQQSDYTDAITNALDKSFQTQYGGHSIMYSSDDRWESKEWTAAGMIDFEFCSFSDVVLNDECPSYEANNDEYVSVAQFNVVADQSVAQYVTYLRDAVRDTAFYDALNVEANSALDGARRRNLLANNFEVESIQVVDPTNDIFNTAASADSEGSGEGFITELFGTMTTSLYVIIGISIGISCVVIVSLIICCVCSTRSKRRGTAVFADDVEMAASPSDDDNTNMLSGTAMKAHKIADGD